MPTPQTSRHPPRPLHRQGSGRGWAAHQTSQIAPKTGILRTTRRKKIGATRANSAVSAPPGWNATCASSESRSPTLGAPKNVLGAAQVAIPQHRQHLLEISRSHLGGSASAGGVRRQPDLLAVAVRRERRRVGFLIGGSSGALIALVFAAGMNLFSYWNADKMVLSMQGAHEVDPRSAPDLYAMVERLARNGQTDDGLVAVIRDHDLGRALSVHGGRPGDDGRPGALRGGGAGGRARCDPSLQIQPSDVV